MAEMAEQTEKFRQAFKQAVEEEVFALAEELAGRIREGTPVGTTSHLRGSFNPFVSAEAGIFAVKIGGPLNYGSYVEEGSRPHWPPFEPIARWVEGKIQPHILAVGITFRGGKTKSTRRPTKVLKGDARERAIAQIAHAVQAKIAREGTQGVFMIRTAIESLGLQYKLNRSAGELVYDIDIATWLARRKPNILDRAKGMA